MNKLGKGPQDDATYQVKSLYSIPCGFRQEYIFIFSQCITCDPRVGLLLAHGA